MGAVSIDVLDARRFRLSQVGRCDSEWLSSGPTAARMIDEQVVRLWLIGGVAQIGYALFMDQIRDRVRALTALDRKRWTWLGFLRAEPMAVALAGVQGESVNKLVQSREQVFDALYSADEKLGRRRVALAKAEDRARMEDALGLTEDAPGGPRKIIGRSSLDRAALRAALEGRNGGAH